MVDPDALQKARKLKDQGNTLFEKKSLFADAIQCYNEALSILQDYVFSDEAKELKKSCLLNAALCYSKSKDFNKTVQLCTQVCILQPLEPFFCDLLPLHLLPHSTPHSNPTFQGTLTPLSKVLPPLSKVL